MKVGLFTLWLIAVAGVIFAISRQDRFFAVQNPVVATLQSRNGVVLVRPHGSVRWVEMVDGQPLHDGDRIATTRGAKATILFGKAPLNLGEDSQIEIKTIQSMESKTYSFTIDLVRGSVVAGKGAGQGADDGNLTVSAGGKRYDLADLKKSGLFKAAGDKGVKTFAAGGPIPKQGSQTTAMIDANFLKEGPDEPDEPEPPAPPPAPPPAKAQGFEAEVRTPISGLVYWTVQPLGQLSNQSIDFPVALPPDKPKQGDWRPALELGGVGLKSKTDVLTGGPHDTVIRVPVMKIRSLAAINMHGGLKDYSFTIRGGAEVTRDKKKDDSFTDKRLTGHIYTFGEYPGGPVSLGFDTLTPSDAKTPWMDPKKEAPVGDLPIQVHLASSMDYLRFMPYVRGAGLVGVNRESLGTDGVFVVRHQEVIAQLGGSAVLGEPVQKLMGLLEGEFVFRGPRSALHDTRTTSGTELISFVGALLDKGKVLYILKRNKLYPVSRDFIKTNNEVAKFIDSQAKAIFLEKVEILAYR